MITLKIFTILNSGISGSIELFKQLKTSLNETFTYLGNQSPKDIAKLLLGLKQVSVQVREFSETDLNGIIDGYNKLKNSITANDSEEFFKSVSLGEKWLEDYLKSLRGAEATIDGVSEAFNRAKKSQDDLSTGSHTAVAGLNALKAASSMVVAVLAAWAVSKAIEWINDWIHANERAVEAAQKLKSEYEDVKNELKNLEEELKTIAERIDELNGKPNLTLTEQSELQRLQDTNQELKTQLEIRKKLAEYKGQKTEEATVEALETKSKEGVKGKTNLAGQWTPTAVDRFDYINEQLVIANRLQQTFIDKSNQLENVEVGSKQWDKLNNDLTKTQTAIDEVGQKINSTLVEIYDLSEGLVEGSPAWEKFTDLINIAQNAVSNFNKEDLTNKFNKVFNADEFTSAREEIEKFIQSGNEFNSEVFTQQWSSLSEELGKTGVSAADAVQHLLATYTVLEDTTEKTYKLSEVQKGLNDSFNGFNQSVSSFQNWMNGVSDSEDNATTAAKNLNDILNQQKNIFAESSEALKVYSEGIQSDIDAMELLNGVVSKLSDGQAMAGKELLDFMEKVKALPEAFDPITGNTINLYDNLANYIKRTGDATFDNGKVIQANLIAYETAAEAKIEAEKQVAQTQYDMEIQTLESIKRIVEGARTAIESLPLVGGAISEALGSSFDNFLSGIDTQISDATEKFNSFNDGLEVTRTAVDGLGDSFKKSEHSINSLIDSINTLATVQQTLEKNKGIDSSSLKTLIDLYPQAIAYANDYAGMQNFIAQQMVALENTALTVYGNMVTADAQSVNMMLNNHSGLVNALIAYYGADYQNFIKLAGDKYTAEAQVVQKLSELWAKYAQRSAISIQGQINEMEKARIFGGLSSEGEEVLSELRLFQNLYDSMAVSFSNFEATAVPAFNSVGDAAKKSGSAAKDAAKEYEQALKAAEGAINDLLKTTIEMLKQGFTNSINKLKDFLDSIKDAYDAEKKAENDSYKDSKKNIDKRKKDLQSLNKEKKKSYDADKKAEKEAFDLIKKRYEYEKQALKDILDSYKKQIQAKIEALNQEEESYDYQKQLDEKQKSITDIQKKLDSIQFATDEKSNKQRRELLEEQARAQAELDEFQYKNSLQLQKDALNQALDEFTESQESKISELEKQFEIETQQYETRLAQMESEHEAWQEYYDAENEALDAKAERLQEDHEAELERIESEYNAKKDSLEKQIKDIEKQSKDEVAIRKEAIRLIEEHSDEFYKNLLEWNRVYGTGVDQDIKDKWNNAYLMLDKFNQHGKIDVQKTLETLAIQMSSFNSEISKAASAMERLAKASKDVKTPSVTTSGGSGSSATLKQAHTGGIVGKTPLQNHSGTFKPNEKLIVVEDGEPILSNRHSASDVHNALDYLEDALPANDTRAMLAAFVNDAVSIQDLIASPTSLSGNLSSAITSKMLANNMRSFSSVGSYEKLPINEVHTHEYKIDNSKEIVGYDVQTMKKIAEEQDDKLLRRLDNLRNTRGVSRNHARSM